ncbi:MAG TPA: FKBP-type peptidyl-prolyl cis-trans isomerase [Candidatus Limnocylindria bacterium]|nr:FKBP-type peptidyl-prolyl cis-trans isomerase [Candidatus Limnocylindria bacterium]
MRKTLFIAANILAVSISFLGTARAQQTSPLASQQTPAMKDAQSPVTKSQQTSTKKPAPAPATKPEIPRALESQKDKESYAVGMSFGSSLRSQSVDVDLDILMRGLKDSLAGGQTLMTDEEERAVLTALRAGLQKRKEERMTQAGEANIKEGQEFLAANKSKDGIITLPSGLQYKILKAGTGAKPTSSDSVVCNYRGTLITGTEFDSSYKRGQPATFPVSGVIKGWTEALQLMPVGSKWQLYIPPDLAYGVRGAPPNIGPNATLIFEVELISIQGKGN